MRIWQAILLGESLLVIGVLGARPLLVSTMTHDRSAEAQRTEAVKTRATAYQARETSRRMAATIPEATARAMLEDRERSVFNKIAKARELLEQIAHESRDRRDSMEQEFRNRSPQEILAPRIQQLTKAVADLQRQANVLQNDATDKDHQDEIAKNIDELAKMTEGLPAVPIANLELMAAAIADLRGQTADLREVQEAAQGNPDDSAAVGLPGHTAWLQERLTALAEQIDDLAAQMPGNSDPLAGLPPRAPPLASDLERSAREGDLASSIAQVEHLAAQVAADHEASGRIAAAMTHGVGIDATPTGAATVNPAPSLGPRPGNGPTTMAAVAAYGQALEAVGRWAGQSAQRAMVRAGGRPGGAAGGQAGTGRGQGSGGEGGRGHPTSQPGQGGGQGGRGGQGAEGAVALSRYRGHGGSGMISGSTSNIPPRIDAAIARREALPGRRFTAESSRSGWLFIDSWYSIGPWENRGRIDFSVLHPPEKEIDLDAEYHDGKPRPDGLPRTLRWAFVQGEDLRIIPPDETADATYYAWTEVFSDVPRTVQVAIASDDAAKVWINGLLVWEDEGQSAWNLDEGVRAVRLREGFNDVLVRIENGPDLCTFSLMLCPPKESP